MEDGLRRIYNDPVAPGSFQGPDKLYTSANLTGVTGVRRQDVDNFLQKEDTYTLNRSARRKFPRNRVVVRGIDTQWDVDLADLTLLGKSNAGSKYFLLAVDVFSRYVWVRPLKSKYAKDVINALDSILSQGRQPKTVRSDGGREFQNRAVKSFLNERGVHLFRTYNETQANYAERAIKTLKSKLYRYLISRNTQLPGGPTGPGDKLQSHGS